MYTQDCGALFKFGQRNDDLTIEATWTKQSGVKDIGSVGRGQNHDSFRSFETVHFGQHLVQRLLTFIVTATEASATLAPNGVNFVNENNGFAHFASLLE